MSTAPEKTIDIGIAMPLANCMYASQVPPDCVYACHHDPVHTSTCNYVYIRIAFSSSVTPLHRLAQVPGARYLPNHKAHGPVDAFDDALSLDSGIPALGALSELEHQVGIILYRTRDLYFCEKIRVDFCASSLCNGTGERDGLFQKIEIEPVFLAVARAQFSSPNA